MRTHPFAPKPGPGEGCQSAHTADLKPPSVARRAPVGPDQAHERAATTTRVASRNIAQIADRCGFSRHGILARQFQAGCQSAARVKNSRRRSTGGLGAPSVPGPNDGPSRHRDCGATPDGGREPAFCLGRPSRDLCRPYAVTHRSQLHSEAWDCHCLIDGMITTIHNASLWRS